MIEKEVLKLKKSDARSKVYARLSEFSSFSKKPAEEWFSELCFCILTANSKARTAIEIQNELGAEGFCRMGKDGIRKCIIAHRHRFHNNKAEYILGAREHVDIKEKVLGIVQKEGQAAAREWIAKNVKGIGYKEASHFLRNVGFFNLAILDRHILNLMLDEGIIDEKPKTLTKNKYLQIEKKFLMLAEKLKMKPAELDLYMWRMKAGEVLK